MRVNKLKIINYKKFENTTIIMNNTVNIFAGENDSGKSTILEALLLVLTGKLNKQNAYNYKFNLDWFNINARKNYIDSLSKGNYVEPPSIEIEAYLEADENEPDIKKYKGTNNSNHEDVPGVKIAIIFDTKYSEVYTQLLKENKITDIPIEYYKVEFRSFAIAEFYVHKTEKLIGFIDNTKSDNSIVLSKFITNSVEEFLTDDDITNLRHAYRTNRAAFINNQAVKNLNQKIQDSYNFENKSITLNLRENEIDEWRGDIVISMDNIPISNVGIGTQKMFKSELFLLQNSEIQILLFEEPENNLSFANMSILISNLSKNNNKQIFVTTHSSYVANKLGLQHLQLVADNKISRMSALNEEVFNYFVKLPGYNTLRLLLAKRVILVEGPADELIIQRAYKDYFNKLPIEDGVDVISVGGLAFVKYCELAKLINKQITIVTDNDGDVSSVKEKFSKYSDNINLCVESNNLLNTLEPSILNANKDKFKEFRSIVYQGNDVERKTYEDICKFMLDNKTEWSLRVFSSDKTISFPHHILNAIGITENDKG